MKADAREEVKEIACQQILLQDASVYSVQWLVVPERFAGQVSARFLLERYLSLVRNCTFTLIRPTVSAEGVQFRLLWTSLALLSFGPPEYLGGGDSDQVHLRINGGLLVQARECDRGMFSLLTEREAGGLRITAQLSDYCPLLLGSARPSPLRRLLYKATQAYLHKRVTVRYLSELYRELTGEKVGMRLIKVRVKEGKET
jgi:hypothetical protein